MSRNLKTILVIGLFIVVGGGITAYFMWNKPKRDVSDEKGIIVTAAQLVKEFQQSEVEANKKYLDKAIQVSGAVSEVKNNQDGKTTIMLASDDAFTGVFCTLKEQASDIKPGTAIVIKGICSGMLTDVRLREAVIVK
jgi:hypothetical protein